MYFKGTIVITDPCYIIKENPIKCPNEEDFGLLASISSKPFKDYSTPEELAYKAALDYYFSESRKYDDWGKCDFGENMEVLGIHNYISESTIYGDWSCTTYQTEEEPKELLESILRVLNDNLEDEEYGDSLFLMKVKLQEDSVQVLQECSYLMRYLHITLIGNLGQKSILGVLL